MGYFVFFTSGIAALIFLTAIRKNKKNSLGGIVLSIIAGFLSTFFGTIRECADGWKSPSIGKQGACSHHGGVVTSINSIGITIIIISIILIVYFLFSHRNKNN